MATLKTINAALKLVEAKKENLKKAYDDLQSHSSLLSSSFSLSWSHLDSHFSSIHTSLSNRFLSLQSLERSTQNHPSSSPSALPLSTPKDQSFSPSSNDPPSSSAPKSHSDELGTFCKNMDGRGLRDYVAEHLKNKVLIKVQLVSAFGCASDPASMTLDSLDGVVGANAVKDEKRMRLMKRSCNVLFQQLRVVSPFLSADVRKKAKTLGAEWKRSLVSENGDSVGAMAFLHFVAAYGLISDLSVNELATFSAMAAANDELPELYQIIGLTDKVPVLVQKLIDKGKHILAVKYVFEFKLVDKIPPVPILKAHVNEAEKLAKRLSQEGKSQTEIKAREIHALKSVIKVIEKYNLDSEYPRASLEQRIEDLTKNKANVRQVASPFAARPPQHQQQQSGIKRPRVSAPAGPAAVLNNVAGTSSTVYSYQRPSFQSSGLLPEHPNPYMNLPAMPYGMMAPTSTISPYTGSTGSYGHDGAPMGPSGNLGQGGSLPNSSEPHVPSGYGLQHYYPTHSHELPNSSEPHDSVSASAYGGYGLQHYYQAPYPQ